MKKLINKIENIKNPNLYALACILVVAFQSLIAGILVVAMFCFIEYFFGLFGTVIVVLTAFLSLIFIKIRDAKINREKNGDL